MMEVQFETIDQVEAYLNGIPMFSHAGSSAANFNLQRMEDFMEALGAPQKQFPAVHVAGTNGKGTTCQMLASVYQQAGYRTGLYTSPHLISYKERFRINGTEITDDHLIEFFQLYGRELTQRKLTYFEITTAIAFWYFSAENVDIAIIETGLGGRLDATNIITPAVSVITSIGMDHTDLLGNTIEEIAREKAGIIKQNKPVVTGELPLEAQNVIFNTAESRNAEVFTIHSRLYRIEKNKFIFSNKNKYLVFSVRNRKIIDGICIAITARVVELLQESYPVTYDELMDGVNNVDHLYPHHAHFEQLLPEREWYFDGAHNTEAMEVLTEELTRRAPPEKWTVVLSFMKDKLTPHHTEIWRRFPNIYLYQNEGSRAASIELMQNYLPGSRVLAEHMAPETELLKWKKTELVIFSGSFYFYEKVRRWMGTIAAQ
ncbi:MAG: folylpolyglutamate synthase/dihydrofolate synthase family protein [Balneolaceae bacterium]